MRLISIATTVGDPSSIGPEVALTAFSSFLKNKKNVRIHCFAPKYFFKQIRLSQLRVHDPFSPQYFPIGRPNLLSAQRALFDLNQAVTFCLKEKIPALVTGPIDKFLCSKIDKTFRGHTEFLQKKTKANGSTMLMVSNQMKVALVTTHLALKDVPHQITKNKIIETTLRAWEHLKFFKKQPKIALCALNPHASDHGLFGNEEKKIILPALRWLQKKIPHISGPYPADSLFYKAKTFDVIICMYHDQGLIPLKLNHFLDAINVTLGLPFLRVSVDHGTAFDLAGRRKASPLSYVKSLEYAYEWCCRHRSCRRSRTQS